MKLTFMFWVISQLKTISEAPVRHGWIDSEWSQCGEKVERQWALTIKNVLMKDPQAKNQEAVSGHKFKYFCDFTVELCSQTSVLLCNKNIDCSRTQCWTLSCIIMCETCSGMKVSTSPISDYPDYPECTGTEKWALVELAPLAPTMSKSHSNHGHREETK